MARLHLKDIKKGDQFYECERGADALCEALEDSTAGIDGHTLRVKIIAVAYDGKLYTEGKTRECDFFEHREAGAYAPKCYAAPEYNNHELFAGVANT